MVDAPSVLGWEEWREIDTQYGLGLVKASLENAMETGAHRSSACSTACGLG